MRSLSFVQAQPSSALPGITRNSEVILKRRELSKALIEHSRGMTTTMTPQKTPEEPVISTSALLDLVGQVAAVSIVRVEDRSSNLCLS